MPHVTELRNFLFCSNSNGAPQNVPLYITDKQFEAANLGSNHLFPRPTCRNDRIRGERGEKKREGRGMQHCIKKPIRQSNISVQNSRDDIKG